jgi:hypothetical protein
LEDVALLACLDARLLAILPVSKAFVDIHLHLAVDLGYSIGRAFLDAGLAMNTSGIADCLHRFTGILAAAPNQHPGIFRHQSDDSLGARLSAGSAAYTTPLVDDGEIINHGDSVNRTNLGTVSQAHTSVGTF